MSSSVAAVNQTMYIKLFKTNQVIVNHSMDFHRFWIRLFILLSKLIPLRFISFLLFTHFIPFSWTASWICPQNYPQNIPFFFSSSIFHAQLKAFLKTVARHLPDWKKRKGRKRCLIRKPQISRLCGLGRYICHTFYNCIGWSEVNMRFVIPCNSFWRVYCVDLLFNYL